jgi:Na+/H+-translocating membrane pyrophosphatase
MAFTMEQIDVFCIVAAAFSGLFAYAQFRKIAAIEVPARRGAGGYQAVSQERYPEAMDKLADVYVLITDGAKSFLKAEYTICGIFVAAFSLVIFALVSFGSDFQNGVLTAVAFVLGALTSMTAGYLGMMIAVFSNARTTIEATKEVLLAYGHS